MKIRHSVRYAVPLLLCMLGLSHAQPPPIGVPVPTLGEGPWVYDVAEEETIRVSVVTQDLSHPWAIAFLPDGGMLITERPGRLRVVRDGVLDPQPISGVPQTELRQRIREVREGPDGFLYLLTDEDDGALLRIEPAP